MGSSLFHRFSGLFSFTEDLAPGVFPAAASAAPAVPAPPLSTPAAAPSDCVDPRLLTLPTVHRVETLLDPSPAGPAGPGPPARCSTSDDTANNADINTPCVLPSPPRKRPRVRPSANLLYDWPTDRQFGVIDPEPSAFAVEQEQDEIRGGKQRQIDSYPSRPAGTCPSHPDELTPDPSGAAHSGDEDTDDDDGLQMIPMTEAIERRLETRGGYDHYRRFRRGSGLAPAIHVGDIVEVLAPDAGSGGWYACVDLIRSLRGDSKVLHGAGEGQCSVHSSRAVALQLSWFYSREDLEALHTAESKAWRKPAGAMGPNERVKSDTQDWNWESTVLSQGPETMYVFDDSYPAPPALGGDPSPHPLRHYSTEALYRIAPSPYALPALRLPSRRPSPAPMPPLPDYYFGVGCDGPFAAGVEPSLDGGMQQDQRESPPRWDGVRQIPYVRVGFSFEPQREIASGGLVDRSESARSADLPKRPTKHANREVEDVQPLTFAPHSVSKTPYNPRVVQHYSREAERWYSVIDLLAGKWYRWDSRTPVTAANANVEQLGAPPLPAEAGAGACQDGRTLRPTAGRAAGRQSTSSSPQTSAAPSRKRGRSSSPPFRIDIPAPRTPSTTSRASGSPATKRFDATGSVRSSSRTASAARQPAATPSDPSEPASSPLRRCATANSHLHSVHAAPSACLPTDRNLLAPSDDRDLLAQLDRLRCAQIVRGGAYGLTGNVYLVVRAGEILTRLSGDAGEGTEADEEREQEPGGLTMPERLRAEGRRLLESHREWDAEVARRTRGEGGARGLASEWKRTGRERLDRLAPANEGQGEGEAEDGRVRTGRWEWVCPETGAVI